MSIKQLPPQNSVSDGLFNTGLAMTVIPGFLEEVSSAPISGDQSLAQKVTDTLLGFSFGSLAMSSVPAFVTMSGVALLGEKIFDTLDSLFTMAQNVEESGKSIQKLEEIIKSFGPMLEISHETIEQLTSIAKEKGVEFETTTLKLIDLEQNYPSHADLLAVVLERIKLLRAVLPQLISKDQITYPRQAVLTSRIELIKQIAEEEKEGTELLQELTELTQSVEEIVTKLEVFEARTTQAAKTKGELITGLQGDVESLIAQQNLVAKTMSRPLYGTTVYSY